MPDLLPVALWLIICIAMNDSSSDEDEVCCHDCTFDLEGDGDAMEVNAFGFKHFLCGLCYGFRVYDELDENHPEYVSGRVRRCKPNGEIVTLAAVTDVDDDELSQS